MATLDELRERMDQAKSAYDDAREKWSEAVIAAAPFKIGDRVTANFRSYVFEIDGIRIRYDRPEYTGRRVKNDGMPGARSVSLYGPLRLAEEADL
jgi:hypothetical protein